ncbi:GDSL esterase/lipase At1g29670-like [Quercus lobata]|uniref:GDSL esterase/lipase At1g29670-like n=1 Tax=Quercus lobata TaxID=97700 RepID=UPI0012470B2F|nr:GDSL esterase/lipase At1g29670-like [Quercus lobata]
MACQMKKKLLLLLLVLLVSNLQHCVNGTQQVPCFFISGDSWSDNGNNNNLVTKAKANYQPYGIDFPGGPTGRFTNGRNLVDIIAEHLGFNNSIPPFATASGQEILKGVNYASGAAGIREETGQLLGDRISLDRQLLNLQVTVSNIKNLLGNNESLATAYLNNYIYSVAIGNNDYLNNYFMPQFYPTSRIYNQLGLLGYTPVELTMCGTNSSCVNNIFNAVTLFNDRVVTLVNDFNNNLTNARFIYINTTEITLSSSTSQGKIS